MENQFQHSEMTNFNRQSAISIFAKRVISITAVIGSMVLTVCSKSDQPNNLSQTNRNSVLTKAPRQPLKQSPKPIQSSDMKSSQMPTPMKRINRSMSFKKKTDSSHEKTLEPHCLTGGGVDPGNLACD